MPRASAGTVLAGCGAVAVTVGHRYWLRLAWDRARAAVAAAVVMGGVAWAMRGVALGVVLPIAAAVYGAVALALGAVTSDDLHALADRRLPLGGQDPSGPLSGEQGPSGPLSGEQGPSGPLA